MEEVGVLSDRGFVAVDVAASEDHCGDGEADRAMLGAGFGQLKYMIWNSKVNFGLIFKEHGTLSQTSSWLSRSFAKFGK